MAETPNSDTSPPTKHIETDYEAYYQGPISDHFDGERFFNPWNPRPKKGFWDILKWRMTSEKTPWPDSVPLPADILPPVQRSQNLRVTYIGHASFLVQIDNLNILIDPVFSDRASPFAFMGPKRVTPPAWDKDALPQIDAVFVSHNHYDHMDLPALSWLAHRDAPVFIMPLGNARLLSSIVKPSLIQSLDWYDYFDISSSVSLTLTPSQHWSRRGLNDIGRDLWGGCFIKRKNKGQDEESVYYVGDSGFHPKLFDDIRHTLGSASIALIPIGAYEPRWFMAYSHMNPAEAVKTHQILQPQRSIGFHFDVFPLTDEAFGEAPKALAKALRNTKTPQEHFITPKIGDVYTL